MGTRCPAERLIAFAGLSELWHGAVATAASPSAHDPPQFRKEERSHSAAHGRIVCERAAMRMVGGRLSRSSANMTTQCHMNTYPTR
ncbi:hypothetical protein TPA0910_15920 [Streptomyces hygroscopicus subsp. sporocinereus]|uniref:Secreted protein n=1 Tax=Streptomyces hygroscopicus TaxID=1912 RepID=A0ABQ3TV39_STRHY|nr:hypothetical protein TPA0910_15920 [Streptomyces hygroscopicus]